MGITAAAISRYRNQAHQAMVETFREKRDALGEVITFATGLAVRVVISKGDYSRALVEGGFADEGTVSAHFLEEDLPVLPVLGAAATYQGRPYRVAKAAFPPGAIIGSLVLRPGRR